MSKVHGSSFYWWFLVEFTVQIRVIFVRAQPPVTLPSHPFSAKTAFMPRGCTISDMSSPGGLPSVNKRLQGTFLLEEILLSLIPQGEGPLGMPLPLGRRLQKCGVPKGAVPWAFGWCIFPWMLSPGIWQQKIAYSFCSITLTSASNSNTSLNATFHLNIPKKVSHKRHQVFDIWNSRC